MSTHKIFFVLYPQYMFLWRSKKNVCLDTPFNQSYDAVDVSRPQKRHFYFSGMILIYFLLHT